MTCQCDDNPWDAEQCHEAKDQQEAGLQVEDLLLFVNRETEPSPKRAVRIWSCPWLVITSGSQLLKESNLWKEKIITKNKIKCCSAFSIQRS